MNNSGSVHYGEFVWAFFNRRAFLRQWSRNTKGLSNQTIREKFHYFDKNGNGTLTPKEFRALLRSFGMELGEIEVQTMIDRFDDDGDGEINMNEFFKFVSEEQLGQQAPPKATAEAKSSPTLKSNTKLPEKIVRKKSDNGPEKKSYTTVQDLHDNHSLNFTAPPRYGEHDEDLLDSVSSTRLGGHESQDFDATFKSSPGKLETIVDVSHDAPFSKL